MIQTQTNAGVQERCARTLRKSAREQAQAQERNRTSASVKAQAPSQEDKNIRERMRKCKSASACASAQERKSTRAQEHLNMKRTFRLTSLHCCQPMSPGHGVEIQLNFERKTFALKNVAHYKPIALCARSEGKHEAQDTERRARSIMYNAALP